MFSCADAKHVLYSFVGVKKLLPRISLGYLHGNPQIANKSLLVTVTTESESEDEERFQHRFGGIRDGA